MAKSGLFSNKNPLGFVGTTVAQSVKKVVTNPRKATIGQLLNAGSVGVIPASTKRLGTYIAGEGIGLVTAVGAGAAYAGLTAGSAALGAGASAAPIGGLGITSTGLYGTGISSLGLTGGLGGAAADTGLASSALASGATIGSAAGTAGTAFGSTLSSIGTGIGHAVSAGGGFLKGALTIAASGLGIARAFGIGAANAVLPKDYQLGQPASSTDQSGLATLTELLKNAVASPAAASPAVGAMVQDAPSLASTGSGLTIYLWVGLALGMIGFIFLRRKKK